jgi:hypothetical protein
MRQNNVFFVDRIQVSSALRLRQGKGDEEPAPREYGSEVYAFRRQAHVLRRVSRSSSASERPWSMQYYNCKTPRPCLHIALEKRKITTIVLNKIEPFRAALIVSA